jgi:hypothetical protein
LHVQALLLLLPWPKELLLAGHVDKLPLLQNAPGGHKVH